MWLQKRDWSDGLMLSARSMAESLDALAYLGDVFRGPEPKQDIRDFIMVCIEEMIKNQDNAYASRTEAKRLLTEKPTRETIKRAIVYLLPQGDVHTWKDDGNGFSLLDRSVDNIMYRVRERDEDASSGRGGVLEPQQRDEDASSGLGTNISERDDFVIAARTPTSNPEVLEEEDDILGFRAS